MGLRRAREALVRHLLTIGASDGSGQKLKASVQYWPAAISADAVLPFEQAIQCSVDCSKIIKQMSHSARCGGLACFLGVIQIARLGTAGAHAIPIVSDVGQQLPPEQSQAIG
jgi:hypothetical protein